MDRIAAAPIALLALMALAAQYAVLPADWPAAARLWRMAGYFTVLTNVLVALVFAARALGARIGPRRDLALLSAILMVGAVYHLVLARLWSPVGLAWWADQGLHTAVPLAAAAWWLGWADKRLGWQAVPLALAWPTAYLTLALLRGAFSGWYPYPFIDATVLYPTTILRNVLVLILAFLGLAAALAGLGRRLSR